MNQRLYHFQKELHLLQQFYLAVSLNLSFLYLKQKYYFVLDIKPVNIFLNKFSITNNLIMNYNIFRLFRRLKKW